MSREEEEEGSLGLEVQVFEKKVERKRFYSSFFFFFFFSFLKRLSSRRFSDVVICPMSCDFLS